jgi:hypothetical protein
VIRDMPLVSGWQGPGNQAQAESEKELSGAVFRCLNAPVHDLPNIDFGGFCQSE